jgi:hypothetical protein
MPTTTDLPALSGQGGHLLVRGGDQAGVIGFEHAAALAFASPVDAHPVEQAAPPVRPEAD